MSECRSGLSSNCEKELRLFTKFRFGPIASSWPWTSRFGLNNGHPLGELACTESAGRLQSSVLPPI